MEHGTNVLSEVDSEQINKFKDMSVQHSITTKLEININIAGKEFDDIEQAILYAYRCGLVAMNSGQSVMGKGAKSGVDQDDLYKLLKKGHSVEHKADFLREIAKEWFPIELHNEKKIQTVHLELIELASYLEK